MIRAAALAALVAGPAAAQEVTSFDGTFRQSRDADCAAVGEDGGALRIAGGIFYGVESQCRMTDPVDVRDMDAVLYDMACSGEGSEWRERAMFMRAADGGLIMVWNGFAFHYDRCPEGGAAAGTVGTASDMGVTDRRD